MPSGVGFSGLIVDADPEAFDWIFGVNVKGDLEHRVGFRQKNARCGPRGASVYHGFRTLARDAASRHGPLLFDEARHLGHGRRTAVGTAGSNGVSVLCPGLVATELHLSKRYEPLPQDARPILDFSAEVMSRGMPARDIGRAAVRGVERGDFFIVDSPGCSSRHQALPTASGCVRSPGQVSPESGRYEVNAVVAAVHADRSKAAVAPNQRDTP